MRKNLVKSGFNLIEVTMAIAIVGIGIAGVMALFPPAIEANKVANNQNYLGIVAGSFLGYLENKILSDFSRASNLTTTKPEPAETLWTGTKTSLAEQGFPGLYSISGHTNIFAAESADGTVNALIGMWQSGNDAVDGFTASDTDKVRRVYVEVSWPAAQPYAKREKKLYIYDVFND